MPKVIIIGDDITGINGSAVLLARQGLKCATFFDLAEYASQDDSEFDAVIMSTESRSVDARTAYQRVDAAMKTVYK